jgi:hypothetical protein
MNTIETTTATPEQVAKATMRLEFPHGIANLTIRADESMSEAYRGEFYGPKPTVTHTDGVISIDYPRFNPFIWGRTSAAVTLSPSFAWVIEIRGGVAHWDGDLRQLEVGAIDVRGGVSKVELRLPPPAGVVPIRVSGGVSHLTLQRPGQVPARVRIGGGASKLELDTQYLGAIGGPVRLETPDYGSGDGGKYDLEIGGGASKVTIKRD